jgi:hypothetical protein
MVAIIKSSGSLRNILHYNENKVKQNVAQLIHSMNFAKDTERLGFTDKIGTLQKLTSLNERTKLNAVHISLNFDPSEKLDKATLQKIADTYMQRIGFGNQPYLVYQHHDSGHPHIHIVSTNIQCDGKRIPMQNIGKNQSEKARKEIEKEFKLVPAQKEQQKIAYVLEPVNAQKIQYGKSETKRAITNVLDAILPKYKYASLPELNVVLKQYNVIADRGSENSRTYKSNGLVYRVLDEKGQKIGAPVKASAIYNKPGMKYLSEKFVQNETLKQPHKLRVKNAIDLAFIKSRGHSLDEIIKTLQKEKIQVVLRQNDKGIIYGITYLDHLNKCVFNGSDLGKPYSANQMQARCQPEQTLLPQLKQHPQHFDKSAPVEQSPSIKQDGITVAKISGLKEIFEDLVQIENEGSLAAELKNEQTHKRKRKRLRH